MLLKYRIILEGWSLVRCELGSLTLTLSPKINGTLFYINRSPGKSDPCEERNSRRPQTRGTLSSTLTYPSDTGVGLSGSHQGTQPLLSTGRNVDGPSDDTGRT